MTQRPAQLSAPLDESEHLTLTADVLVIGGGPAGDHSVKVDEAELIASLAPAGPL